MKQDELTTASVFAMVVGACTMLLALGAGYWWVAHHLAWWTFALSFAGVGLTQELIKAIVKEIRKSGGK